MSKYRNPISEPRMVTIPVWEYARLVSKSAILETVLHMLDDDNGVYIEPVLKSVNNMSKMEADE